MATVDTSHSFHSPEAQPVFQGIAAFDLDHTILKCNSSYGYGEYLYNHGALSFWTMLRLMGTYYRHKFLGLSLEKLHQTIFDRLFLGKNSLFFQDYADRFLDHCLHSILNPDICRHFYKMKEKGFFTVMLSSSPNFLVERIAKRLKFDAWGATDYKVDQSSRYCKIKKVFKGKDKAIYLDKQAEQIGVSKEKTYAYSDSILDLPMLEAVEYAIVVNPDYKLRAIALKRKWKII